MAPGCIVYSKTPQLWKCHNCPLCTNECFVSFCILFFLLLLYLWKCLVCMVVHTVSAFGWAYFLKLKTYRNGLNCLPLSFFLPIRKKTRKPYSLGMNLIGLNEEAHERCRVVPVFVFRFDQFVIRWRFWLLLQISQVQEDAHLGACFKVHNRHCLNLKPWITVVWLKEAFKRKKSTKND